MGGSGPGRVGKCLLSHMLRSKWGSEADVGAGLRFHTQQGRAEDNFATLLLSGRATTQKTEVLKAKGWRGGAVALKNNS